MTKQFTVMIRHEEGTTMLYYVTTETRNDAIDAALAQIVHELGDDDDAIREAMTTTVEHVLDGHVTGSFSQAAAKKSYSKLRARLPARS